MTDYERELRRGVAATIAGEAGAPFTWRANGTAYGTAEFGIFEGIEPGAADRAITLNTYSVQFHPDTIIGLQVAVRAKAQADVDRAVQAVADVLEGRWGGTLGNVTLVASSWQSGTPLTQDSAGRRGRTDNYYLKVHRPVAQR